MLTISEAMGCNTKERERDKALSHIHVTANNQSENALYRIIILRYYTFKLLRANKSTILRTVKKIRKQIKCCMIINTLPNYQLLNIEDL